MTMFFDHPSCRSSRWRSCVGVLASSLALHGCLGILPDEIDVADGETGGDSANDTADEAGDGDGDPGGDGDGEATTTGDGDGDATGDGDGDGDPSTGDGDGDPSSTGDGDGDTNDTPIDCEEFGPTSVYAGQNPVELIVGFNSFAGSCGGVDGPDAIYSYIANADGVVTFVLQNPEFDGVIYLAGDVCDPLDELACDPAMIAIELTIGEVVYVIVDSNQADVGGTATLVITEP